MQFDKEANIIVTNDLYYDLFNGTIGPEDLLLEQKDIDKVENAIEILETFMDGAITNKLIKVYE
ncbi:MAG: hypothetical protein WC055_00610 [Melioribacteraceae bacterium]